MANQLKVREIKKRKEPRWMAMKEVAAVGIGKVNNQRGIIISVAKNSNEVRKRIPENIDGVPIMIQQTGEFKAQ